MRFLIAILAVVALAGCANYRPRDDSPDFRARLDHDIAQCRAQAEGDKYVAAGTMVGTLLGALYGAVHGAAAGAGAGSSAEGALFGAAAGAGLGFIVGLGASSVKYNETVARCMESRGHHPT